jgi:hypothetical protein
MDPQDIIEYALRYISEDEITDFPRPGEIFALLARKLVQNKILKDDEGWQFAGYNICDRYELDTDAKPAGKWIWVHFVTLSTYPPVSSVLKLQPPHIVKGTFQNPDRTEEYKMVTVGSNVAELLQRSKSLSANRQQPTTDENSDTPDNIISFPGSQKK